MKKSKGYSFALDAICFLAGSFIYAISVSVFTAPNHIAAGGVTGIATLINHLFELPIGITALVLNIPLFIWAFIDVGYQFIGKTMAATVISSLLIDITASFMPVYTENILIVIVVGGLLAGLGLSLIFIRGGTTGGTDLIANLLNRRIRHLSLGKFLLLIDCAIVFVSAFVYKNIESPFYAFVVIFICSKTIDTVLYGTDSGTGKMMFIISPKSNEIAQKILYDLDRGVTGLKSRGCYSNQEGETLLCAVRRQEVYKIYEIVHTIDPSAFIMVGDAGEITGEGFKQINSSGKRKKVKAADSAE